MKFETVVGNVTAHIDACLLYRSDSVLGMGA